MLFTACMCNSDVFSADRYPYALCTATPRSHPSYVAEVRVGERTRRRLASSLVVARDGRDDLLLGELVDAVALVVVQVLQSLRSSVSSRARGCG